MIHGDHAPGFVGCVRYVTASVALGSVMIIVPGTRAADRANPAGTAAVPVTVACGVAVVATGGEYPTLVTTARSCTSCTVPCASPGIVAEVGVAGIDVQVCEVLHASVCGFARYWYPVADGAAVHDMSTSPGNVPVAAVSIVGGGIGVALTVAVTLVDCPMVCITARSSKV